MMLNQVPSISIGCSIDEKTIENAEKQKRLSKPEKKQLKREKKLENYKLRKEQKKLEKKLAEPKEKDTLANQYPNQSLGTERCGTYRNKRDDRAFIRDRLKSVYIDEELKMNSLKVCVDCSFSSLMKEKEQSKLAQQIGRCYASLRATNRPVHFTLCNLDKNTYFYDELCRTNDGFDQFIIDKSDKKVEETYQDTLENVCYLSPDAREVLLDVNKDDVYVLGGLVDETVSKKVTLNKSAALNVRAYRLPIEEYMKRRVNMEDTSIVAKNECRKSFNFNKILSINQVLDILINFNQTREWKQALASAVPKRKGFFVE